MHKFSGLFLLMLSCAACHDNTSEPTYYITPSENKITADYTGLQTRIAVRSNCDWTIPETPKWCIVRKTAADGKEYVEVDVLPNDTENPRNTTLLLSYRSTSASLLISQSGKTPAETEALPWHTFLVNTFDEVKYDIQQDGHTRRYQLTNRELFVSPSLKNQIFPGNMIDSRIDNLLKLKDYYADYTFNPITISTQKGDFSELPKPSLEGMNELAQKIIADLPSQSFQFVLSSPVQYTSYRHLHLLGLGNMGLDLDKMVSGKPYSEKEMERQTGMLYMYSHKLFDITMDYPEKLVHETISEPELSNRSYINSVNYGKTALLLIEADQDFKTVKSVVTKIVKNQNLSDGEMQLRDNLDVWYVWFDKFGEHITRGNYTLIGRYVDESKTLSEAILPLSFTTNNLKDYSVGSLEITLELP